jgi:hypothetical protein
VELTISQKGQSIHPWTVLAAQGLSWSCARNERTRVPLRYRLIVIGGFTKDAASVSPRVSSAPVEHISKRPEIPLDLKNVAKENDSPPQPNDILLGTRNTSKKLVIGRSSFVAVPIVPNLILMR